MNRVVELHPRAEQREPDAGPTEPARQVRLATVERSIERIGARYLDDLRALSEELDQFYREQLAEKDRQIAAALERASVAERERATLGDELADTQGRMAALEERAAAAEEKAAAAEACLRSVTDLQGVADALAERARAVLETGGGRR